MTQSTNPPGSFLQGNLAAVHTVENIAFVLGVLGGVALIVVVVLRLLSATKQVDKRRYAGILVQLVVVFGTLCLMAYVYYMPQPSLIVFLLAGLSALVTLMLGLGYG